jgi:hypothetical protein
MKLCHLWWIKMSRLSKTRGAHSSLYLTTLLGLSVVGLGGGCVSHTKPTSNPDAGLPGPWTRVLDVRPNNAPAHGNQASVRVISLAANGAFIMFEGFVNASTTRGPYTISEGDPIAGFAGHWIRCNTGIRVAYVKSYYWPDELKEFSEPVFGTVHLATIEQHGSSLKFENQVFFPNHGPSMTNLAAIVPPAAKVWVENPKLRSQIDGSLTCESGKEGKN